MPTSRRSRPISTRSSPCERPRPRTRCAFPSTSAGASTPGRLSSSGPGAYVPDPSQSAQWNRGAYLVNGPGHCQQCHTPRNWLGALDESRAFAGADLAKEFGGKVPDITSDPKKGIGDWTEDDIVTLLSLGMTPKGDFVGGEMSNVVDNQTSKLPKDDVQAIAVYLRSIPPR